MTQILNMSSLQEVMMMIIVLAIVLLFCSYSLLPCMSCWFKIYITMTKYIKFLSKL